MLFVLDDDHLYVAVVVCLLHFGLYVAKSLPFCLKQK